jgi:integrase
MRPAFVLALLVGCALRRRELSALTFEDIQLREGRWVIVDLVGTVEFKTTDGVVLRDDFFRAKGESRLS